MTDIAIIPREQIELLIRDVQFIKEHLTNHSPGGTMEDFVTDEQLCKKLSIHPSTLWRHEKRGKLTPIKIGNTKMYRLSEVIALNTKARK